MVFFAQSFQAYPGIRRYTLLVETAQCANPTWGYKQKVKIQKLRQPQAFEVWA
jgi:hypothetical protein